MRRQVDIVQELQDLVEKMEESVSDLDWNSHEEVIKEIEECPPTRTVSFSSCCNIPAEFPIEDIYVHCPKCQNKVKVRCFGSYIEIEDILLASKRLFEKRR